MVRRTLFILFIFIAFSSMAQRRPPNLPYFDDKFIHFGWYIGYNELYTNTSKAVDMPYLDSIMSYSASHGKGFAVGVLADMRLMSFLHLRTLPMISFNDREFEFMVQHSDAVYATKKNNEVIYAELPIELKIMSKRWHDFRPYLIAGAKYAFDLGSIKRKKLSGDEFFFKFDNHELFYTLGVGFDFYLEYFKLGIELKSSFGINDILDHDYHTVYADCIEKMRTQMFYINITFQ